MRRQKSLLPKERKQLPPTFACMECGLRFRDAEQHPAGSWHGKQRLDVPCTNTEFVTISSPARKKIKRVEQEAWCTVSALGAVDGIE